MYQIYRKQRGLTLIELIISIVVLSVTAVSLMMLVSRMAVSSADPMVKTQAVSLIQAYQEKLLSLPLKDPQGEAADGPEEASAVNYDDVTDYYRSASPFYSETVNGYGVEIRIEPPDLSRSPDELDNAYRLTVSVSHSALSANLAVTSYRWR